MVPPSDCRCMYLVCTIVLTYFSTICGRFLYCLRILVWFGYNPQIVFCPFFHVVNFFCFFRWVSCVRKSTQFLIDCLETLRAFSTWSDDVHAAWI